MCATCGCSDDAPATITDPATGEHTHPGMTGPHRHGHDHGHAHVHGPGTPRIVRVEADVLSRNRTIAEANRRRFAERATFVLNLMSSPGSGKTTLLERTIRELGGRIGIRVIEGDQETTRDADRIRAAGAPVLQVNTGTACHLDAAMVEEAARRLDPPPGGLLVIENVGNLICPALFDLGEGARAVVASVTEGDDKPLKYPHMYRSASLVLLNKIDLLPHVDFDAEAFEARVRGLAPGADVHRVSARTGQGLGDWYRWLATRLEPLRTR